jgi:hypothetical protein
MKRMLLTITLIAFSRLTATGLWQHGNATRSIKERVWIVGDAAGVLRGVEAFVTSALHYVPETSPGAGTDCVVAPMSLTHRPE